MRALHKYGRALAAQRTDKADSAGYNLQTYDEQCQGLLEAQSSPLQLSILQEFVILTNHIPFNDRDQANPQPFKSND